MLVLILTPDLVKWSDLEPILQPFFFNVTLNLAGNSRHDLITLRSGSFSESAVVLPRNWLSNLYLTDGV